MFVGMLEVKRFGGIRMNQESKVHSDRLRTEA